MSLVRTFSCAISCSNSRPAISACRHSGYRGARTAGARGPRRSARAVAVVVGSDAALAARILRLANSAFLNPSAMPIKDLQLALTRLGHQTVRCTAVSFALQQMNLGSGDAELRPNCRSCGAKALWWPRSRMCSRARRAPRSRRGADDGAHA